MKLTKDKVLLVFPQFKSELYYGRLSKVAPSLVPVSLVYLASFLQKMGVPAKILDGQVQEITPTTLRKEIEDYSPRFIGITVLTPIAEGAHQVAAIAKEVSSEITVIMGGTHPTVLPDETMKDENVDIVVRREGEHALYEIVNAIIGGGGLEEIEGLTLERMERLSTPGSAPFWRSLTPSLCPIGAWFPLTAIIRYPMLPFENR